MATTAHLRQPTLVLGLLLITAASPAHAQAPAGADPVWLGGTDASGLAFEGGIWDFEDGTTQGWTSEDLTAQPTSEEGEVFFRRRTDADFAGDPESAVINGNASLWVGAHTDETTALCWPGGMGYGNDWAVGQRKSFTYGGTGSVTLEFDYFVDSETGFDYTYVEVVVDGVSSVLAAYTGSREDDMAIGSPDAPAHATIVIGPENLPVGGGSFEIRFYFDSDAIHSDALDDFAGFLDSIGAFGVDDISVEGTGLSDLADFETDTDGWSAFVRPGHGTFLDVAELSVLEEPTDPESCPLVGGNNTYVLHVADLDGNGAQHPPGKAERIVSPPAYVGPGSGYEALSTRVVRMDAVGPVSEHVEHAIYYRTMLEYHPWICPETGEPGWSLDNTGADFSGTGVCASRLIDFSDVVPATVDSLRVAILFRNEATSSGVPSEHDFPYWDDIRIGLAGSTVDAPEMGAGPALAVDVPTPFRRSMAIDFSLPEGGPVSLAVADVTGRFVRTLVDGTRPAGRQRVHRGAFVHKQLDADVVGASVIVGTPPRRQRRTTVVVVRCGPAVRRATYTPRATASPRASVPSHTST